jgi:hypothetical protein
VLENFEGRHRNLLDIFESRAAEMDDALAPHAELSKDFRKAAELDPADTDARKPK